MGALLFQEILAFLMTIRLYWVYSMRSLSLRLSPFFVVLGLIGCFAGAPSASAKVSSNEFRSIVRIDIPAPLGTSTSSGSGVMIDQDGRVLTSYSAVAKLVKDKVTKATICIAKDEFSLPTCTFEAALLKTNAGSNLALLQIRRVLSHNEWRSVEEEKLRTGFSFPHVTLNKSTSTETVGLSDDLFLLDYTLNTQSSITQYIGHVTGFERKTVKDKLVPWVVKTDVVSSLKSAGGAVFNDKNELVGVPTMVTSSSNGYALFTSLPVINAFLKEALGTAYVNNKFSFVFDGSFIGVQGGGLNSTSCPESSHAEAGNKTCTCNNGFFAVGNACILGANYCQIMYPKSSYDIFLKACTCLVNGETRICPENLRKVIQVPVVSKPVAPTVATTTKITSPTSTKAVPPTKVTSTKPLPTKATTTAAIKSTSSTPSGVEVACKKNAGWSYVKKTNVCVPVGKLSKQADLALCNVVAMPATKYYFLKGNAVMKRMTYKNKLCFVDEAAAIAAKYRKSALTK
jgi:S1-C subfamily serine protease